MFNCLGHQSHRSPQTPAPEGDGKKTACYREVTGHLSGKFAYFTVARIVTVPVVSVSLPVGAGSVPPEKLTSHVTAPQSSPREGSAVNDPAVKPSNVTASYCSSAGKTSFTIISVAGADPAFSTVITYSTQASGIAYPPVAGSTKSSQNDPSSE